MVGRMGLLDARSGDDVADPNIRYGLKKEARSCR